MVTYIQYIIAKMDTRGHPSYLIYGSYRRDRVQHLLILVNGVGHSFRKRQICGILSWNSRTLHPLKTQLFKTYIEWD